MKWAKGTTKKIMNLISNIKSDGSIQKSNIDVVDQMSGLFTFKRNNYDLPDWLQIYSPNTIECLGGVDLLKQTIATNGEEMSKESISTLAESIETKQRAESRSRNERFVTPEEIIQEEKETKNDSASIRR